MIFLSVFFRYLYGQEGRNKKRFHWGNLYVTDDKEIVNDDLDKWFFM